MSKGIVHTHAGDDSDGKIWGIEGANILFLLAGALVSIGLALLLSRHHAPAPSVCVGAAPFIVITIYVIALRQGRPRGFDTDFLETLVAGSSWTPPIDQPRNPLQSNAST